MLTVYAVLFGYPQGCPGNGFFLKTMLVGRPIKNLADN
jgi:hypothetical protein